MGNSQIDQLNEKLDRLLAMIERVIPKVSPAVNLEEAHAFVWQMDTHTLMAIKQVSRIDMALLKGIDRVRDILVENTRRFAQGYGANNALLWGARGMGKSSLVKAAHASINQQLQG